ncbi:MAG: dihydroorotate dehydrogenase electron transfer subunit [Gammaproteobacteria bacterium]|jgi:dihydroorotate dehydrogenase electron transfer subunit
MPDPRTPAPTDTRASILVETGRVVATTAFDGDQVIMRIAAPRIASRARAGHFIHLRCSPERPMRRPMSIMLNDGEAIDILFKVHGAGTRELAARTVGEEISLIGPIGQPFRQSGHRRRPLLIGGGVGIPPMVFLAKLLRTSACSPFVIMGSEVPFPFTVKPSRIMIPQLPAHVTGTMPLLEDWGVACRLASLQGYAGCFEGYVTELADQWIAAQDAAARDDIEIYACGPTPMLKAVAELAARHALPCQISLEEYMACAVGGCAGCAVAVRTSDGPAMKRVCVDGPVFEAADVVFD